MPIFSLADEPMFDITYNKYDTNEIAKRASNPSLNAAAAGTVSNRKNIASNIAGSSRALNGAQQTRHVSMK